MSQQQTAAQNRILLEHGARPDVRLFTNPTSMVWVGRRIGTAENGGILLAPGAHPIRAGLIEGSSDLVGIGPGGRFAAIEVKTAGYNKRPEHQRGFLRMVYELGGLAGFAMSPEDAGRILAGEPLF